MALLPDSAVVVKYVMEFNNRMLLSGIDTPPADVYAPRADYEAIIRDISARNERSVIVVPGDMELLPTANVLRWKDEPREHIAFKGVKMFPVD